MPRSRFLFFLLLFSSTAAFADFHIESSSSVLGIDNNGNVPVRVTVVNATKTAATNVKLSATGAVSREATGWTCSDSVCTLDRALAPGAPASISYRIHFDTFGRKHLDVVAEADLGATHARLVEPAEAVLYRRFTVTQSGDSGAGSLRAQIEAINADAVCRDLPCGIDFDIVNDLRSITLRSPLPQIQARDVTIDGFTQTVLHGAAIAIDGGGSEALDFNVTERAEVRAVGLTNFSISAILLRTRRRATPFDASAALSVTQSTIIHNFRGITIAPGYLGSSVIRDNTISDNVRSAIFDYSEHDPAIPLEPRLRIERNQISGNGASGIFLGEGSDGALIADNAIGGNREFGVAVAKGAREVRILANSIAHNGASAIDLGLDGPTPTLNTQIGDRNAAVIDSARYDAAANTTTITGRPSVTPIGICDLCSTHTVSLYANDAAEHGEYAEAQTYLGEAQTTGTGFTFTFIGDLRGKYITALSTRWINAVGSNLYDTAELSKAVRVE